MLAHFGIDQICFFLVCFETNVSSSFQTLANTSNLGWGELCVVRLDPAPVKNGKNVKTFSGLVIGNLKM